MWHALALALCVLVIVWRTEVLIRAFLPEWLAIRAKRVEAEAALVAAKPEREPLPPDLEAIADRETEAWAREQVRAAIQDEYEQHRDWDRVRSAYFGAET